MASVKSMIRDWAGRAGFSVLRQSSAADQARLLAMMKPVETEHPLIRIGDEDDGGYLVPEDLDGIEACFSPGVGPVSCFEQGMLDRGIRTFQIDASVDKSHLTDPRNVFERKFLGIDSEGDYITLDDWVGEKLPGSSELLLQMDIEGHEWLALAQVSTQTLLRFRVIVLEVHFLDRVFDEFGPLIIEPVLARLRRHFDIVHLHANNYGTPIRSRAMTVPPVVELTLLRKDRSTERRPVSVLPHPYDRDNNPRFRPVPIPETMYR
jgi:hypothetical protein